MNIKVWGCRGSLPTPSEKTIRYGGNTTCLEIRLNDNTLIIIDAGSGIRNLGKKLLEEQNLTEMYLFLTHAHWDHLIGFPFFAPGYLSKYKIHVCGGECAQKSLEQYLRRQMEAPYFPVPFDAMNAEFDFTSGNPDGIYIGSAEIIPIPLSHPNGGRGFKIIEEGRTFVFLTDNELDFKHESGMTQDEYISFSKGANLLIHDAQYTEEEYRSTKGWGHTTFSSATELSIKADVKRFGLFHHDPEHTDDDMDEFVASCQRKITQANSKVECFGVREGMEIIV
jgi:phosphoribosyl 1,2-cyclic phosphodiesterase